MNKKIAIFTDPHALYEPTLAVLNDMEAKHIKEIYCLGDTITVGPSPKETIELLQEYNVILIAGNSEEYYKIGLKPYSLYFNEDKIRSYLWSISQLDRRNLQYIEDTESSIDVALGNKAIGLCHFANDIRFDFGKDRSVFEYIRKQILGMPNSYQQFLQTNSKEQLKKMRKILKLYQCDKYLRGYSSALAKPLFAGKQIYEYDTIIQGHTHFKFYDKTPTTNIYTIRAVGMGYGQDNINKASYIILTELSNGFNYEEILVEYDREQMIYNILNSSIPSNKPAKIFTRTKI
ncbi:MAG: metallophosphoesterase [bacterium]|nr:metallophosphoesterase [bacterium]